MPARLTAYLPDSAAASRVFDDGAAIGIGRDPDATWRLDHPSISRRHAELRQRDGHWSLRDAGSKHGTHVDGARTQQATLARDAWLRFGDVYCEFALLDAQAAAAADARRDARRARATALTAGIGQATGFNTLLDGSLHAVIELAHCRRGFVLLHDPDATGDAYRVRARHSLDADALDAPEFSGSAGAVDRALRSRRAVVVNDIGGDAWLAARQSVVAGGLSALVCLPLLDADRVIGAIYADRDRAGEPVTTLDLELLQAFAERAALYIAARRASDALGGGDAPRWTRPRDARAPHP